MTVDVDAEKMLWLTVIRQAQWDAEGRGEVDVTIRRLAVRWLTTFSRSFLTVCSLAGMERGQAICLQEKERKRWKSDHSN
jgi:hypothetical protein